MRLWIVTSPEDFSSEYDDIEDMFKRGLTRLILDKRGRGGAAQASLDQYERWLLSLPMEYKDMVWVRGTPDMAEYLDIRGCVCDAHTLCGTVPENWKRINCIVLCKSLVEVENLPEWVSGALIGPIFQPNSAYEPVKTVELSQISTKNNVPLIFWGGMEPESLNQLSGLKPAGIACLGGIWNYADPINAFIKLQRATQQKLDI